MSKATEQLVLQSLVLWSGGGAHLSCEFENDWHSHHTYQLTIPLEGSILEAATEQDKGFRRRRAILLSSNEEHSLRVTGTAVSLYLDPESQDGRRLRYLEDDEGLCEERLERVLSRLGSLNLSSAEGVRASAIALWECLLDGIPVVEFDTRVEEALRMIRRSSDLSLTELADAVSLSPSRLRHLFRADVGIPIRTYSLWRRAQRALHAIAGGASLTDAAHECGFSDLAHLSRTHRRFWATRVSDFREACLVEASE